MNYQLFCTFAITTTFQALSERTKAMAYYVVNSREKQITIK